MAIHLFQMTSNPGDQEKWEGNIESCRAEIKLFRLWKVWWILLTEEYAWYFNSRIFWEQIILDDRHSWFKQFDFCVILLIISDNKGPALNFLISLPISNPFRFLDLYSPEVKRLILVFNNSIFSINSAEYQWLISPKTSGKFCFSHLKVSGILQKFSAFIVSPVISDSLEKREVVWKIRKIEENKWTTNSWVLHYFFVFFQFFRHFLKKIPSFTFTHYIINTVVSIIFGDSNRKFHFSFIWIHS